MGTEIEDFLEHYGTKGMKWGVRKGKRSTGISRTRSAQIDRNQHTINVIKDARSGKKFKRSAALGKKLIGEQKQKENWSKLTKDLKDQNKRILSGKETVADKIAIYGSTNIPQLLITRK